MDDRRGIPVRGLLLLAVFLLAGFVLWSRSGDAATRLSAWRAGSTALAAARAPAGLSGVAQERQLGRGLPGEARPEGNPLQASATVMTQGYGVGTHAPAEIWGAIDLAVDGNGDGYAEGDASWYTPIVATHDGTVTVSLDTFPAGNHVWVNEPGGVWRTGYSHLAIITVISGQYVRAGEQIGLLGSSGMSSGPHLDYQVWRGGVNVDPTVLVGCS